MSEWTTREQLILASAVQRSGDQNWISVSRAIKPLVEADAHPADYFSHKNCAQQYSSMLDKAGTHKRKRSVEGTMETGETAGQQIVRELREKYIDQINISLSETRDEYMALKKEIEDLENGELESQLPAMWEELQLEMAASKETLGKLKSTSNLSKHHEQDKEREESAEEGEGISPTKGVATEVKKGLKVEPDNVMMVAESLPPVTSDTTAIRRMGGGVVIKKEKSATPTPAGGPPPANSPLPPVLSGSSPAALPMQTPQPSTHGTQISAEVHVIVQQPNIAAAMAMRVGPKEETPMNTLSVDRESVHRSGSGSSVAKETTSDVILSENPLPDPKVKEVDGEVGHKQEDNVVPMEVDDASNRDDAASKRSSLMVGSRMLSLADLVSSSSNNPSVIATVPSSSPATTNMLPINTSTASVPPINTSTASVPPINTFTVSVPPINTSTSNVPLSNTSAFAINISNLPPINTSTTNTSTANVPLSNTSAFAISTSTASVPLSNTSTSSIIPPTINTSTVANASVSTISPSTSTISISESKTMPTPIGLQLPMMKPADGADSSRVGKVLPCPTETGSADGASHPLITGPTHSSSGTIPLGGASQHLPSEATPSGASDAIATNEVKLTDPRVLSKSAPPPSQSSHDPLRSPVLFSTPSTHPPVPVVAMPPTDVEAMEVNSNTVNTSSVGREGVKSDRRASVGTERVKSDRHASRETEGVKSDRRATVGTEGVKSDSRSNMGRQGVKSDVTKELPHKTNYKELLSPTQLAPPSVKKPSPILPPPPISPTQLVPPSLKKPSPTLPPPSISPTQLVPPSLKKPSPTLPPPSISPTQLVSSYVEKSSPTLPPPSISPMRPVPPYVEKPSPTLPPPSISPMRPVPPYVEKPSPTLPPPSISPMRPVPPYVEKPSPTLPPPSISPMRPVPSYVEKSSPTLPPPSISPMRPVALYVEKPSPTSPVTPSAKKSPSSVPPPSSSAEGKPTTPSSSSSERRTSSSSSPHYKTTVNKEEGNLDVTPFKPIIKSSKSSLKKQWITRSRKRKGHHPHHYEDGPSVESTDTEEDIHSAQNSAVSSPAPYQSEMDPESLQTHKQWKKAIIIVWRHAAQHKYANLFLHPVREEDAPGYKRAILRPMDLSTIKKKIESGMIRTDIEFQRDMLLMFQNAFMYNNTEHEVYFMAQEMKNDVMENIQAYLATQAQLQLMEEPTPSKTLRSRESRSKLDYVMHDEAFFPPSKKRKTRADD